MTTTMTDFRTQLLAHEILKKLEGTAQGHCARVDFLSKDEAVALCHFMREQHAKSDLAIHVLATEHATSSLDSIFLTTDQAIEQRNRKERRLCLFVPSELVDAANSSLANSFAPFDGHTLQVNALKQLMRQLSHDARQVLRFVARGALQASQQQRLDFAIAAHQRQLTGETALLGLDLWRVGLVCDARPDFAEHLVSNRTSTLALSRPTRFDATTRERIQSLKVEKETARALEIFFRGRSVNNVFAWSRDLTAETLTLDCWQFLQGGQRDLNTITVRPFVNKQNAVEKYCLLSQEDQAGGSLKAGCGSKGKMVMQWTCEPEQPRDVSQWSVRILPMDWEGELDEESDFTEPKIPPVPAKRRKVTIKLDIEEEEIPSGPVCVYLTALDATGNEIVDEATNNVILSKSTEFFLVQGMQDISPAQPRESRVTVPTFAYGQLEIALDTSEQNIVEQQAQWSEKDLAYVSLPLALGAKNPTASQKTLTLGISIPLLALEKRVRDEPRSGGCFTLTVDEVQPVPVDAYESYSLASSSDEAWSPFWKAREAFFARLKKMSPRDVIEAADWTPDLAKIAINYAQAYSTLLDTLIEQPCEHAELRDALSVDSLLVQVKGKDGQMEEAVVILPTHPLRVAWYVGYTQLLHSWKDRLLRLSRAERKRSLDLRAVRQLAPMNVPAFTAHAASRQTFLFFQNLHFFHGVAFPAEVPDPQRRLSDLTVMLQAGNEQIEMSTLAPAQLKAHFVHFQELHQYTQSLVTTLVNPDRGNFFAEAVKQYFAEQYAPTEADEPHTLPTLAVTAYMQDRQVSPLKAIEQVRQQIDQQYQQARDYFLPTLATTVRPISQLEQRRPPEAHLALITDFTRPTIVAQQLIPSHEESSFALYGLIVRFLPHFTVKQQDFLWQHTILLETTKKPEHHPVQAKYSEVLITLQQNLLHACGYLLSSQADTLPMLEIRLAEQQRQLLERLHTSTNWVISLDRFFTLDYYDSPHEPELSEMARKYVLDYAPEAIEGLGHRMMVTTSWHEEIESLLSQAMNELGFQNIDQSVSHLLHYLKTVSGRLALQALESPTSAAAAVGLGVVTAYLREQGRLKQAILIPVDAYPQLFSPQTSGQAQRGERRCDLLLLSLRRSSVEATFIEVKWRRGQVSLQELAADMVLQMESSALAIRNRFFNEGRVDSVLQRAYLANIIRFYFERARRYRLFDAEAEKSFQEQLVRLEKANLDFKPSYEGYIVNLEGSQRKLDISTQTGKARITVLTMQDLHVTSDIFPHDTLPSDTTESEPSSPPTIAEVQTEAANSCYAPTYAAESTPTIQAYAEIQETPPDEIIVSLGESRGEPVLWQPSTKSSPHLFIVGIPGQGKSWTITRILCELGKQHVPSLVLDFHGQFADAQEPFARLIHPTVVDAAKGLPFSPFECTTGSGRGGWKATSDALAEIFATVTGLGPMQQELIFNALCDAYQAHGFDEEGAQQLDYPTAEEVLRRILQKEQANHINNVAARCRPLLEMDLFKPIEGTLDLLSAIRQGLVIDLHNLFTEKLQIATGAFVLRKLYKDMFTWGSTDRLRLAIVLDEAHRLSRDVTLPKLMKEGRKFGIAIIVASQSISDFHADIPGTAGTKILFRVNYPDSKKVAGFIRTHSGQNLAEQIEQLPVGTAYVQTPEMPLGSEVQMYPLA